MTNSRPSEPEPSLASRTVGAARWQLGSNLTIAVVHFVVGVVLARLLPPADFGLVALAMVVTGFAIIVSDLGLAKALIQRPNLTERHKRVALTASTLIGIAITLATILSADRIGELAASRSLPAVLRVLSLLFIVAGVDGTAKALLRRDLDFRRLFFVDFASYLLGYSLVGISLAVSGFGVWSLVAGALSRAVLSALFATVAARPPLKPLLSVRELRDLASYGVVASANGIVNYAGRRGDAFLIGRHMGETVLGLYSRAVNLTMLAINYLTNVLLSVLFPSYSQLQEDRPKLRRGFIMSVELTSLVTVPLSVGMIVSAPHLIRGLYGEQWVGAVLPLQILSIGTLPRALPSVASALSHACDRVGTELLIQVAFFVGICAAVILGAPHGLPRVAMYVTIVAMGFSFLTSWLALSITGASWRAFLVAQLPGFFVGAITAIGAVPVRIGLERLGTPSAIVLLMLIVTCALSVFIGTYVLPRSLRPTELFTHVSRRPRWMSDKVHEKLTRVLRIPEDAGAASG